MPSKRGIWLLAFVWLCVPSLAAPGADGGAGEPLGLALKTRQAGKAPSEYAAVETAASWDPRRTAIILCDMWDHHWCRGAEGRAGELAPRIDALCAALRERGVLTIHAPSDCMKAYADHPARKRAKTTPRAANVPAHMAGGCSRIPAEKGGKYPIDQSDGGCDCQPPCKQGSPWMRQHAAIRIADTDFLTDSGIEVWNVLEANGIRHVLVAGVHTNMCVLGRPFGLRNLVRSGKEAVLVRDLTDTMYNSRAWPYVSHYTGTDRIIEHIEKFVCPTIGSEQILGGAPFRFRDDGRKRLMLVIADQEYDTARTLPQFAADRLGKDFQVGQVNWESPESHSLPGLESIERADAVLLSVWRRQPPAGQLEALRRYVAAGKPVIGIRTASHAFARRKDWKLPAGHAEWPEFDREVLGCHYTGHHGNHDKMAEPTMVWREPDSASHPILAGMSEGEWPVSSWLYKVLPVGEKVNVLLWGRVGERKPIEPVAWTNVGPGGNRVFYTSLGHPDDFADERFQKLLERGIYWSSGLEPRDQ